MAAMILKKEGYSLIGVFMRFWSEDGANRCCDTSSEERARIVARTLDIPFYVIDMREEFKRKIVDPFISESLKGVTPNPCVYCNKEIKFGSLFQKLTALSVDSIATGHYVLKKEGKLFAAKDKNKDQSYFLWKLNKKQIERSLFPIGGYQKSEVREMARQMSFPTKDTPDSQELCFVGEGVGGFLKRRTPHSSGDILDKEGNILGKHEGAFMYTIGQRKGIGLSGGPYYVVGKKGESVIVTKDEKDLYRKEVPLKEINIIGEVSFPEEVRASVRYTSPVSKAILEERKLTFENSQRAVCPGQSAVFYKNEELIGGGVIDDYQT